MFNRNRPSVLTQDSDLCDFAPAWSTALLMAAVKGGNCALKVQRVGEVLVAALVKRSAVCSSVWE